MQDSDSVLRIYLPALRSAHIFALGRNTGRLQLDKDSLSAAPQLELLCLCHVTVTMTPDCFTGLTALATLDLIDCSLTTIPPALTALAGSLTSLMLPFNDGFQLDPDAAKRVLALGKLRELDLRTKEYVFEPQDGSAWKLYSLQGVVELLEAFLLQHGHWLAIRLHRDTDS